MSEWVGEWVSEWVGEWVSEWVSGWVGEWVGGWVNEWVSDWLTNWLIDWLTGWLITTSLLTANKTTGCMIRLMTCVDTPPSVETYSTAMHRWSLTDNKHHHWQLGGLWFNSHTQHQSFSLGDNSEASAFRPVFSPFLSLSRTPRHGSRAQNSLTTWQNRANGGFRFKNWSYIWTGS